MTAEIPAGFDAELQSKLKDKFGESWADQLALKWGIEWTVPCENAMERVLGYGWESQLPDTKSEALLKLLSEPVAASAEPEVAWEDPAGQAADQSGEVPAEVPAYDDQAWQAFLTKNGPQWDGTESTWTQFTEWFSYHASQGSLASPAAALLDYLTTKPADERITIFRDYGVTIHPVAPQETAVQQESVTPGEQAYDEQAWLAYIAKNGQQWDGTEATWDQFTAWFAYHANVGGFAVPADALLRYLSSLPVAERTASLWPASRLASEVPAEPEGALEPEESQELGAAEPSDEDIESIMRELLEEDPELAEVPEDIRRQLVIESINEVLAEEA
jgi:hypothetical protein